METAPVQYAIVDGAVEEGLLDFLQEKNPPHCCLFPPPVQPDLEALAPWLVEVTPEVTTWLDTKETPWGIYVSSYSKIHVVLQHFRRCLWVNIPERSKPVLFRFYDPRNIWSLVSVLTPRELLLFIDPIDKISTWYAGEEREDNFSSHRRPDARRIPSENNTILTFSHRQYENLSRQAQNNYIQKLTQYIHNYYASSNYFSAKDYAYINRQAEGYFLFCQSLDITDDRSVRGIVFLLLNNTITDSANIPQQWLDILSNKERPAHNRVEMLLLQELGFIPQ